MKKFMGIFMAMMMTWLFSADCFAGEACRPGSWKREGEKVFTCPEPGKFFPDPIELRGKPQQWRAVSGVGTRLRRGESLFLDDIGVFITCDNASTSPAAEALVRYDLKPGQWAPGSSRIDGPLLCDDEYKRANSLVSISDVRFHGNAVEREWATVVIVFDRLAKLEAYWAPNGSPDNFREGIEVQVMDAGRITSKIGATYAVGLNLKVVREKMGTLNEPFHLIMGTCDPASGCNLVNVRFDRRQDVSKAELEKFPEATFLRMTLMTTMGGWEPKVNNLVPMH